MSGVLVPSALIDAQPVFLFDLTWGGRTFRLSTLPITISSDDGDLVYDGGMDDPEIRDTVSRLDVSEEGQSATVAMDLPINVAQFRRRGHPLSEASGEISLVSSRKGVPVQAYEARIRLLVGFVTDHRYGDPEEGPGFLEFTLQRRPFEDSRTLIPLTAVVSETTWGNPHTSHIGKPYPIVIGEAGHYRSTSGGSKTTSGSPAYAVEMFGGSGFANKVIVAGHSVKASTVLLFDENGTSIAGAIVEEADLLGRIVSTVDVSAEASDFRGSDEFWAGWNTNGGHLSPFETGTALSGAGDVAEWILGFGGIPVDHGRWKAASTFLNRLKVATYINDPEVTGYDWLVDHLLPLLPVSVRVGIDGVAPVIHNLDVGVNEVVAHLTDGEEVTSVSGMIASIRPDEVRNQFRLEYAKRGRTDDSKRQAILVAGEDREEDDPQQISNLYATVSKSRHGVLFEPIETDIVYDPTSANLVLDWMSRLMGFIPEELQLEAHFSMGWLAAGDVVAFTSSRLSMTESIGMITEKAWNGSGWDFTFLFEDDIPRDARAL